MEESQGNGARQDLEKAGDVRQSSAVCWPGAELPHSRQVSVPGCSHGVSGEDAELGDMLLTGFKFICGGYCSTAGQYLTLQTQLLD